MSRDKLPGTKQAIHFYKVYDIYKSDNGDDAVIQVNFEKYLLATNKNTKNLTLPVSKYFDHKGPMIFFVITRGQSVNLIT